MGFYFEQIQITKQLKMRIGIYTQPLRYNYGGLLQAWALQTILKRLGHQVVTFDPNPYKNLPWYKKPFSYCKRFINKCLGKTSIIRIETKFNKEHDIKIKNLKPFIDANINRKEFCSPQELRSQDYDVLIAGSDQVWRPKYNRSYGRKIEHAFFDFAKDWNVRRIAYAASFGTNTWEYNAEQTAVCSALAQKFAAISVREEYAVNLCKIHLRVSSTWVLDPTLLLCRKDYEELIRTGQPTHSPKGNLLCYILDETTEAKSLIQKVSKTKGLLPFRANSHIENKDATIEEKIQPPVEQWLRNFQEAKFVVTDSFHACVFSIIFNKPFVVLGNIIRGTSRYESLFNLLSLNNHLLFTTQDFDPHKSYEIGKETYLHLKNMQDKSLQFITESLTNEK